VTFFLRAFSPVDVFDRDAEAVVLPAVQVGTGRETPSRSKVTDGSVTVEKSPPAGR
jgi:hypothetical protein